MIISREKIPAGSVFRIGSKASFLLSNWWCMMLMTMTPIMIVIIEGN